MVFSEGKLCGRENFIGFTEVVETSMDDGFKNTGKCVDEGNSSIVGGEGVIFARFGEGD